MTSYGFPPRAALSARRSAPSEPTPWAWAQRLLAAFALLLATPLFVLLWPLVRFTSPGPFLYRQQRPGLHARPFTAYKIRTMRQHADRDPALARSVRASSPEVTRIGGLLRDLKLDELPQLWNVLRGDMDLVGPRPIAVALQQELEGEIEGFARRLEVRPGLTNLGQVCILESAGQDRVVDDWRLRFEAEQHYLDNRSAAYDMLVIALTLLYVARKLVRRAPRLRRLVPVTSVLAAAAIFVGGCATTPSGGPVISSQPIEAAEAVGHPAAKEIRRVSVPSARVREPDPEYRVGPGDILAVNVFAEPGMSDLRLPVDANGYIQLPVLETVEVGGLTPVEIQRKLKNDFAREFNKPWVVVAVAEYKSRPLYLLGELNSPGVVYLDGPTNVVQALGHAKGLGAAAYLRGARVLRAGAIVPVDINALLRDGQQDQNLWLESGDTIYVPSVDDQQIVILGAVERPGAMTIGNQGLTLLQVIARAEGTQKGTARTDQIRIIRSLSPVRGELITVDADQILDGQLPDLALMAGDIVYVPQNALGDWNDVVNAIKPSVELMVSSLQPFVQLKFLTEGN